MEILDPPCAMSEPIKTLEEHEQAILRLEALMISDLVEGSKESQELIELGRRIEIFEKAMFPIGVDSLEP